MQMLVNRVEIDEPEPPRSVLMFKKQISESTLTLPASDLLPIMWVTINSDRTVQATGKWGYAPYPATIYPVPAVTAPSGDWVGTDEAGYTSAQLKARIMPIGDGAWWAQLGNEWLSDHDGITEYPSARMAREQVERRREAERG
jgi:hypothetical protein